MHYCIAVFTETDSTGELVKALEPFDENLDVETEIYKTKQEIIDEEIEWAKETLPILCENFPENIFYTEEKKFFDQEPTEEEVYEHYVELNSYAEFDEDGNELSSYNNNAQWDWYQVGGRWSRLLKLKDGSDSVDTAMVSDIDFEGSSDSEESDKEKYKRFWEIVVEGSPLQEGEVKPDVNYDALYYEKIYGTKENYIKANTQFITFGYLTLEGEWVDKNNTNVPEYVSGFEKYVAEHQDLYLTIVDIHI